MKTHKLTDNPNPGFLQKSSTLNFDFFLAFLLYQKKIKKVKIIKEFSKLNLQNLIFSTLKKKNWIKNITFPTQLIRNSF
jgi:hypothetical protein